MSDPVDSDRRAAPDTVAMDRPPAPVALRSQRDRVIARLSDAFADERLEVDELERRLTLAHRARTFAELAPLVADLAPAAAASASARGTASAPGTATALAPAVVAPLSSLRAHQTLVAFMGGVSRSGAWISARQLQVVAIMGGVDLDFRDAQLGPGVTEIVVLALMGGVHITVPPGLAVEVEGMGIMGGFDHSVRTPVAIDPERPRLRVRGLALMGGVGFDVRLAGESRSQARRRRRHERRLRRREQQRILTGRSH
jgi:hypothetical protein